MKMFIIKQGLIISRVYAREHLHVPSNWFFRLRSPPKPSLMEIASVGIPERAETSPLERFVCINSSHDFTAAR